MYADRVTKGMATAIEETDRRRSLQLAYNRRHHITPESIVKSIDDMLGSVYEADYLKIPMEVQEPEETYLSQAEIDNRIRQLRKKMRAAASAQRFEKAAELRDRIRELETAAIFPIPASSNFGPSR